MRRNVTSRLNLDCKLCQIVLLSFFSLRCFHVECERQVEGHLELQTGEDYVCSMCKHAGFEPVPRHAETEERETHMDVDTDTQPAQSVMDCEPTQMDRTDPGQTVTEPQCEVGDVTEHKESGKIRI